MLADSIVVWGVCGVLEWYNQSDGYFLHSLLTQKLLHR